MTEAWARCIDFPRYEASSWGRIRRIKTRHILKQQIFHRKYLYVWVSDGQVETYKSVARLVSLAFYQGELKITDVVRFKDRNSFNCALDNLYFDSPSNMVKETWERGLYKFRKSRSLFQENPEFAKHCRGLVGQK